MPNSSSLMVKPDLIQLENLTFDLFVFLITEARFSVKPPSHIACACLALALHGLLSDEDIQETLTMMQQVIGIDSVSVLV